MRNLFGNKLSENRITEMHRRMPSPRRTRIGVDSRTLCSVSSNAFP